MNKLAISKFRLFHPQAISIIMLVLFFASCNHAQENQKSVKVGEKFVIELPSNRSTGYSWHYIPKDNSLIDSVKVSYETPQNGATGNLGIETWEFIANLKGEESLLFEYKRAWEDVEPAQTHIIHLKID
ncbi:protease inhibitor I42 family protein [Namhaeicola litoreus]|uniref:Protease inhibitor I42 family protein n=1 Tax=Namhaeicola litoreus TaxID=1052145 RepID=A0ABW3Y0X4_9FLAO